LNEETNNKATVSASDLESLPGNDELRTNGLPSFDTPVHIHVRSIRRRLADADGICAKAAIDGIVHAKILANDSPKEVAEVSYSQEKASKGSEEITIITIEAVTKQEINYEWR